MSQKRREGAFYLAILMPALLLLVVFFAIPVVQSLILSFTDSYGMKSSYNWVGFANYVEALTDNSFRGTISTTFTYTLVAVLGSNLLALALALMLDNPLRGRNVLRAVFFIPNIMSLLVVGYVWRFVYTGAVPDLLQSLGAGQAENRHLRAGRRRHLELRRVLHGHLPFRLTGHFGGFAGSRPH